MVTTRRQSELRQLEQPWSSRGEQQAGGAHARHAVEFMPELQELHPASQPVPDAPVGRLAVQAGKSVQEQALPLTPLPAPADAIGSAEVHTAEQQLGHEQQASAAQLKSALKAPRPVVEIAGAGKEDRGPATEVTPAGQGIKKKVRIHSSNNIVHVFGKSSITNDPSGAAGTASAGDSSSEATPQSRWKLPASGGPAGPVVLGTPALLKYQAFIRSFMGPAGDSGSELDGPAHQAQAAGEEGGGATLQGLQQAPEAANGHSSSQVQQQGQQQQLPQGLVREGGKGGSWGPAERSRSVMLLPWVAVVAILGWMFASSALIFLNKVIMVDSGFRFPFALTALGSATSTLLGCAAGYLGMAPLRPHPSLSTTLTKLLPIALCSAATLFLGNYAYLGLTVAFINILKALTPAVTLGASMLLGQERPSLLVTACLALIAGGTAISTAQRGLLQLLQKLPQQPLQQQDVTMQMGGLLHAGLLSCCSVGSAHTVGTAPPLLCLSAFTPSIPDLVDGGCIVCVGVGGQPRLQQRPHLRRYILLLERLLGRLLQQLQQESSTDHFSWLSFTCFILSILFEALRVVLVERLLGRQRLNAIEVLVYLGPLTFFFLLWGAVATEWSALQNQGLAILVQHPALFVGASLASFAVNAFSFLAIQASSSLTFKVAGCLKNAAVVWLGVATGDTITAKEAGGYALSLLGFLGYTLLRSAAAAGAGAARQGAKRE
ncbi:hypothetical protein N2152v2_003756 [Parachlorella kessleri]